uniref:Uncharacterized protein n=1 Tax=Hucho hucho TaxID=62062 RepID=A0A4W5MF97_9TELE
MELQLLASGSPDLEVLGHVFHSLLGAVRANPRNAALLYHQGGVKTILTAFQNILSQSDSSYEDCQTVLVELLVAMMSQQITAEELALLIRLFQEKNPPAVSNNQLSLPCRIKIKNVIVFVTCARIQQVKTLQ